MSLCTVEALAAPAGLFVMGACHPAQTDAAGRAGSIVLLGAGAACWPTFKSAPEFNDARRDPLDRWSKRVIGGMALQLDAQDVYPSDGPPYAPFIDWALDTGRFFQSPTGMMIHDTAGLMISIRGALVFDTVIADNEPTRNNPCDTCPDRPCESACPVGALAGDRAYDVPTCKTFLATAQGADCMDNGCKVRRICPVSATFDRAPEQSAFHMKAFKGQ